MGCCLSKTDPTSPCPPPVNPTSKPDLELKPVPIPVEPRKNPVSSISEKDESTDKESQATEEDEKKAAKKKEVFVIQHRKSNDRRPESENGSNCSTQPDPNAEIGSSIMSSGQVVVRTSSCTKEEVDAILIQCGRLSRSSSGKANNGGVTNGRKYSGSKRSYDFDRENETTAVNANSNSSNGEEDERLRRRGSNSGSQSRRRSRERSGSRDRDRERDQQGSSGSSRRVSRSPGRRSESPLPNTTSSNGNGNTIGKPGKLVSVPATVSNGEVKRVLVKRNVGSPRSQSPARGAPNGTQVQVQPQQQPASLSRNGSRKAEQSPYRRTPLNEIDLNSLPFHPLPNNRPVHKGKEAEEEGVVLVKHPLSSTSQNKYTDTHNSRAVGTAGTHRRSRSRGAVEGLYDVTKTNYCRVNNEVHTPTVEYFTEHSKGELVSPTGYDALVTPVIVSGSGSENLKLPQTLMRSRSSRRSRDLDINVDALLTPTPATDYNSLLLQDIQNFHQSKSSTSNNNNSSNNTPFSLPPCVTKACSILEAVADLNSTTTADIVSNKRANSKDPFVVESEVKVGDDLMEPSFHKYVTVRKRGGELDGEESSGSNSFVAGATHNWVSSSSWEPSSADSTDCWTSNSKSYTREDGFISPVGFQRHAVSELGCGINSNNSTGEKFHHHHQQHVVETRGRIVNGGGGRGPMQASKAAAASM